MSGNNRVLVVEDRADDRQLLGVILRERLPGFDIEEVGDAVSFAESLAGGDFSAAVVSQEVAWADAIQVVDTIRRHHSRCQLFVLSPREKWQHGFPVPQWENADALPKTSAGLLALPERIKTGIPRRVEEPALEPAPPETVADKREPVEQSLLGPLRPGRSTEELEELAYALSHDLLGTVNVVNQYARLLKEHHTERLDADASRYLSHLLSNTERLGSMVDAALGYLRSDGKDEDTGTVDCDEVLDEALEHLGAVVEQTHARIESRGLPTVTASRRQLVQVFQNLIENAVKFRREVTPHIEISATEHAHTWEFSVRDNGLGIEPSNLDRIFTLFQSFQTSQEYQGTGIGLAMCKRIVERHGGRIWAESVPNEGSTFYFTISKNG